MHATVGGRKVIRHETADCRRRRRVGIHRSSLGIGDDRASIPRHLDRRLTEHREAVEARFVHPDPDREPLGPEAVGMTGLQIDHLFQRDLQGKPNPESGKRSVGPGPGGHHQRSTVRTTARHHLDLIPDLAQRFDRISTSNRAPFWRASLRWAALAGLAMAMPLCA